MRSNSLTLSLISYGLLTIIILGLVMHIQVYDKVPLSEPHPEFPYQYNKEEPLDEHQACQFPNPDPYDKSLKGYIYKASPVHCKGRHYYLTYLDSKGYLCLNETGLHESGYKWSSITCKYQQITRAENDDYNPEYGPQIYFNGQPTLITAEYITVFCVNFAGFTIYSNYHSQVLVKNTKYSKKNSAKLSVFIFIIDSLSRLQCIRQLPKTYNFLTHKMEAVVLRGAMVVGDNTFPNVVPILTGKPVYYFPEFIKQGVDPANYTKTEYYDNWPLIFKDFEKNNYTTLLLEDWTPYNLFNYLSNGFRKQPTTIYPRPFWLALENSYTQRISSNLCLGSTPKHLIFINYVKEFIIKHQKTPYFALSNMAEIGHNVASQVGAADDDLLNFLKEMYYKKLLENTVFVFMGDHGQRLDSIAETNIGSIEKRMPFMAVYLPKWFKTQFYTAFANLRANSKNLVNVFDLHEMLKQILSHSTNESVFFGVSTTFNKVPTSLFERISLNRSCEDVYIPKQFCICDEEMSVSTTENEVREGAKQMVKQINEIIFPFSIFCKSLTLKTITRASVKINRKLHNLSNYSMKSLWSIGHALWIRLVIMVSPSNALYEGLLKVFSNGTVTIWNEISRINVYGNQASCIPKEVLNIHKKLPLYCYC